MADDQQDSLARAGQDLPAGTAADHAEHSAARAEPAPPGTQTAPPGTQTAVPGTQGAVPGSQEATQQRDVAGAAQPGFSWQHLTGRQPPFGARASLGPEPPAESQHAETAPDGAGNDSSRPAPPTPIGPGSAAASRGIPDWPGAGHPPAHGYGQDASGPGSYGLADYGPAGPHQDPPDPAGYGPADPPRPDPAGPADHYGPAGAHDPYAYGQETYSPPDSGTPPDPDTPPDLNGPPDPYGPADPYGQQDPYDSWNTYGPADIYGSAGPYEAPATQGPLLGPERPVPHQPGPAASDTASDTGSDAVPGDGRERAFSPATGQAGAAETAALAHGPVAPIDSLTRELLLPGRRRAPSPGWRRVIYQASGGLLRVPSSAAELRRRDMIIRVRAPVAGGHHRVAVMSLKGGVGKTTTTMGLGSTLASLRGDRIIAVDANPDRGTLSDKVGLETAATVRDLLNERGQIRRYADVRTFTSQAASRLEVLASDRDPTVSVAFSAEDYCNVSRVLEHYYSICLTDCGTGLLHSAMSGVLRLTDQIILVSTPSVDGARSASATLDWLAAHSYGDLVRNAVVVLSAVRPRSRSTVDLNRLEEHFAARCRAVTRVPYDAYLEEGAEVELDQLSRPTAEAYLALAALIGDGLATPRAESARLPA